MSSVCNPSGAILSKRTNRQQTADEKTPRKNYSEQFVRLVAQARRILHRNSWILNNANYRKAMQRISSNDEKSVDNKQQKKE
ncbi:unnamed protein product [Anisakis simplex]|uniref:Uncharacterized protein n=1 Tax=Anisakis simplex TaxID=6269 RepID=A0A0M3JAB7_ANISI|nr:unnamed protein product [Anisakis simplex]